MNCEDAQVETILCKICDDHPELRRARERLRREGRRKLSFADEFIARFRESLRRAAQETK